MGSSWPLGDADGFARLEGAETRVLGAVEERRLLHALAECKRKLTEAMARARGADAPDGADADADDDAPTLARYLAAFQAGDGPSEACLGAVFHRYRELRGTLALANMRLVAHVAKRFRDRGIAYPDLIQEGFCGLLEAIDRFDLGHETKLATYATWWIRQSMQRAVASGAYPVRLSPRHLRQLARNQDEIRHGQPHADGPGRSPTEPKPPESSSEMIHRIHAATRPTVSLNASIDAQSRFHLHQTLSGPEESHVDDVDMDETITRLLETLRPREQEVLALRFGLRGRPRLSLSQVGKTLSVSKERIRQIQDRALEKLRDAADAQNIGDLLLSGA